MMYIDIENERERLEGKIELFVSAPIGCGDRRVISDPLAQESRVHLVYTKLIRVDRAAQILNSAICTFNLKKLLYDYSFHAIKHKAKKKEDLVKNILKIHPTAVELPSMSIECWDAANETLNKIRRKRMREIMSFYANGCTHFFSHEEFAGAALEAFSIRVNRILNGFIRGKEHIFPSVVDDFSGTEKVN